MKNNYMYEKDFRYNNEDCFVYYDATFHPWDHSYSSSLVALFDADGNDITNTLSESEIDKIEDDLSMQHTNSNDYDDDSEYDISRENGECEQ